MNEVTVVEFIEKMIHQFPIAGILMDRDNKVVTYNADFQHLLLIERDVTGLDISEVFAPLQWDELSKNTTDNKCIFHTIHHQSVSVTSIPYDSVGTIVFFVPKQNKELQKELNLLETVINSSLDEIFVTDGEGRVLKVNTVSEELYDTPALEMIGKKVGELAKDGFYSPALYPIINERKEKVSMIQRTRSGKIHHVIGNPVFDKNNNISHIVFIGRDLTEIEYLKKKIEKNEKLLNKFKAELEEMRKPQEGVIPPNLISYSPEMKKLIKLSKRVAAFDSTVLISGESGVGKGVIAQHIHQNSNRKNSPLIHVNCGAIPDSLIESELFGYEAGAFTGASTHGKKGLIEKADNGTLFLDEIGEMPLHLQVKLLRVLQEREIQRVGGDPSIKVNIRVIAATNKNIEKLVRNGEFREDLYYRLNVIPVQVPPLRARPEDISYLIDHFIDRFSEKYGETKQLTLEAENILMSYHWPGNVRELENTLERMLVVSEAKTISVEDIPSHIVSNASPFHSNVEVHNVCPLKQAQEEMEEQLVRKAYELFPNSYKVAEALHINQSTAVRKIQKYIKKAN